MNEPHTIRPAGVMDPEALGRGVFRILETGDAALAAAVISTEFHNTEAKNGPAACATQGPAGVLGSSVWLRSAFADLHHEVVGVVTQGDQVWLRLRMQGRHDGAFIRFADGKPDQVVPPTGRRIDAEQVHMFGIRDGRVVGHEAVRDDIGMLGQLGVFPPSPVLLARMTAWKLSGRAGRAAAALSAEAQKAASAFRAPRDSPS